MSGKTATFTAAELGILDRALDQYAIDAPASERRAVNTLAGRLSALRTGRTTLKSRPGTARPSVAKQTRPNYAGAGTHTVKRRAARK